MGKIEGVHYLLTCNEHNVTSVFLRPFHSSIFSLDHTTSTLLPSISNRLLQVTSRYCWLLSFFSGNKSQGISIVSGMGVCFSSQIKAENPCSNGLSSKCVSVQSKDLSSPSSKVENDLSNSSNKVLVPQTLRSEGEILQSSNLKSFSLTELTAATRNFGSISVLGGEGGFGSVFKGWIDDHSLSAAKPGKGIVVAVKRLNQNSFQGHKAWLARHGMIHEASLEDEVNYLGQLSHPHLVKLIGYCFEDNTCLLVYEFMSRGSLENHLFLRGSYFQPLSWGLRLKVALGAAKGLAFLHRAETKVMYRDFRTSNVLLDSNYNAKLSDFGLVKEGPMVNKTDVRVFGNYGRAAAPEYIETGHMTAKSDVFSFGVVLLEMISGKRAIDKNRPSGQQNLVEWAKPYLPNKSKLLRVLDNRLEGQYTIDEAYKVATLSLRCLATESKLRPDMDEVVTHLEQLQVPHEVRTNQSRSSNSSRPRRKSADDVAHCRVATAFSTFT